MTTLALTLGIYTAIVIAMELACWRLLRRKMSDFKFPSPQDSTGSHTYHLMRLRTFSIVHTALLITLIWIFLIVLWW